MIDKNWLAVVHCVVGGRIPDGDLEGLCKVLDVEEEVLPYLLITGQAFREWPLAIAGFRQAIRSNPRTGLEMPRGDGSAKTEAMRRELENAIVARMKERSSAARWCSGAGSDWRWSGWAMTERGERREERGERREGSMPTTMHEEIHRVKYFLL